MADIWTPVQPVDETAEPRWEDQHPGEGDLPASLPAGGLTGQHLAKASDINWDVAWVPPEVAALFTDVTSGLVPASGGGATNFLRADGAWSTPPGSGGGAGTGDVVGPGSAVADNIAVFSGTTGKIIVDGGAKISDLATAAALVSGLAGKANATHTHAESDVTGLVGDLAAKAPLASPVFTGDPTAPTPAPGDNDTSLATSAFVQAALAAYVVPDGDKGDITITSGVWAVDANAVTYAKIQDVSAASRLLGRGSASGAGDPQEMTAGTSMVISGTALQRAALTGDVTASADSNATTIAALAVTTGKIADNAVDNTKLADMATARLRGRVTAATGDPEDLTGTQATTLLDTFTSALKGLAPSSGGGTTNFLRADGTWAAPAGGGTGDVVGPASSVANRLASFSGTTGKLLQDSGKLTTDFANATHTHAESDVTNLVTDLAAKAPIASPVFTGTSLILNQVGAAATAQIIVRADAGQTRDIYFQTGTSNRFRFGVGSQTESGANAGSDFIWSCWADDGTTFLGNILTVTRATRLVAFVVSPTAPTPSANDNSTKVATTAYVDAADVKQEVLGVRRAINTQTGTTYTFVANDAGKVVEGNNASAITFTVPPNSSVAYAAGTWIDITQYGAGKVSIAAGAGVTIRSPGALLGTRVQYSGLTLVKRATDEWYLFGDLG